MGELLKHENFKIRSGFYSNFLRPGLNQHPCEDLKRPNSFRAKCTSHSSTGGPPPRPRSACWQALPGRCRPATLRRDALPPERCPPKPFLLQGALVDRDGNDIAINVIEYDRSQLAIEASQSCTPPTINSLSPSQDPAHLYPNTPAKFDSRSVDWVRSIDSDRHKHNQLSKDVSTDFAIMDEVDDGLDVVERSESAIEFHDQDSSIAQSNLEQDAYDAYSRPVIDGKIPAHIISKVRERAAAEAREVWARISKAQNKNIQKLTNRWALACHIPGDVEPKLSVAVADSNDDCGQPIPKEPENTICVGENAPLSTRDGRGSIYHAVGEIVRNPGPGHYESFVKSDAQTPHPWAQRGNLIREKNLGHVDLERDGGLLGPGSYDAKMVTANLFGGSFSQAKRCNVFSRDFADSSLVAKDYSQFDVVKADSQDIATKFPSTPVTRLDHYTNDANLDYRSATWRLGGNLIISAPGGPCNSATETHCWRHERPPWCRARAARLAASWHVSRR